MFHSINITFAFHDRECIDINVMNIEHVSIELSTIIVIHVTHLTYIA